jgi:hypothetical protein
MWKRQLECGERLERRGLHRTVLERNVFQRSVLER